VHLELLALEEELHRWLSREQEPAAADALRKSPRSLLEAPHAVWKSVEEQETIPGSVPIAALHAAEAARVEGFAADVDRPPRRNQFRALAATVAEALLVALLVKK
jgi:ferric-dicitrate binding protein FerR (iron transport regulator)